MLSLVDLIEAGTVDQALAAYLAGAVRSGASFLVGARPGGAGKTAVQCALLNFLPDQTVIRPVDSPSVLTEAERGGRPGDCCYLAHEIGSGPYYAYIWGPVAQAFFRLAANGHTVASNLHADTLDELIDQLCVENSVEKAHLDAVGLKLFLRVEGGPGFSVRRIVSHVYENDGTGDRLLWTCDGKGRFTRHEPARSAIVTPDEESKYAEILAALVHDEVRHLEEVRHALTGDS